MRTDSLKLLFANSAAQAIQWLAIPALSRLYKPENFGLLGSVQAVAALMVVIQTLQIHQFAPRSASLTEALGVCYLTLTVVVVVSLIGLPVSILLTNIGPLAVFLGAVMSVTYITTSFLTFLGDFTTLSLHAMARSSSIVAFQLLFAIIPSERALVFSAIAGEFIALVWLLMRKRRVLVREVPKVRELVHYFRLTKNYSVYGTPQELVATIVMFSPIYILTVTFTQEIVGQYSLAYRLVWAPVGLIATSLVPVLYNKFAKDGLSSRNSYGLRYFLLGGLAVLISSALLRTTSSYFILILGSEWKLVSELLPPITLWAGVFCLSTPFRVKVRVLELQKFQLVIDFITLVALSATLLGYVAHPSHLIWTICVIGCMQNVALCTVVQYQEFIRLSVK